MASLGSLFVPRPAPPDPAFLIEDWEPAYLEAARGGLLHARVEVALKELEDCCACPRDCHVNRLADETPAFEAARKAGLWRFDCRAGAPSRN